MPVNLLVGLEALLHIPDVGSADGALGIPILLLQVLTAFIDPRHATISPDDVLTGQQNRTPLTLAILRLQIRHGDFAQADDAVDHHGGAATAPGPVVDVLLDGGPVRLLDRLRLRLRLRLRRFFFRLLYRLDPSALAVGAELVVAAAVGSLAALYTRTRHGVKQGCLESPGHGLVVGDLLLGVLAMTLSLARGPGSVGSRHRGCLRTDWRVLS
ncbi:hypothetical protein B0T25DRAFT_223974 [Lasiosphaeria hispida]|uniref:Uncharacterized protein n=1 Tax=Lasiosphaeria hispida TaxID=260671 RepID=A0AAJ0HJR4_9PEZI|nr:hypothetical protein B0T25DRAFT_223974 [Lasiosphaeria hispida]